MHKDDHVFHKRLDEELRRIEEGLCRVRDTRIVALVADGDSLGDVGGNQEDDDNSNIVVFISRINQSGTVFRLNPKCLLLVGHEQPTTKGMPWKSKEAGSMTKLPRSLQWGALISTKRRFRL